MLRVIQHCENSTELTSKLCFIYSQIIMSRDSSVCIVTFSRVTNTSHLNTNEWCVEGSFVH
jgi:hypothetical protein